ncbi:MAG: hypothetical protein ACREBZ_04260 [Thermoplasmata archaeon]
MLGPDHRGIAPAVLGIIIVVVAVVVVVGGLYAAGVFTPQSSSPSKTYTLTFTETGLPSGTSWAVVLDGASHNSATSTISFSESNGSYSFTVPTVSVTAVSGYSGAPSSGPIHVNGANISQAITFTNVTTYSVTFTETGLASETSWSVTLNGATESSTTASIVFTEANGTYSYTVGSVSDYTASPSSGRVTVSGVAVSQSITFTISVGY